MQQFPNSDEQAVMQTLTKRRNIYTVLFVITLVIGGVCGNIPNFGWYISIAMLVIWGIFAGFESTNGHNNCQVIGFAQLRNKSM